MQMALTNESKGDQLLLKPSIILICNPRNTPSTLRLSYRVLSPVNFHPNES